MLAMETKYQKPVVYSPQSRNPDLEMDGKVLRAAQAQKQGQVHVPVKVMGSEAAAEGCDWRNQLPADSRHRIVNKMSEGGSRGQKRRCTDASAEHSTAQNSAEKSRDAIKNDYLDLKKRYEAEVTKMKEEINAVRLELEQEKTAKLEMAQKLKKDDDNLALERDTSRKLGKELESAKLELIELRASLEAADMVGYMRGINESLAVDRKMDVVREFLRSGTFEKIALRRGAVDKKTGLNKAIALSQEFGGYQPDFNVDHLSIFHGAQLNDTSGGTKAVPSDTTGDVANVDVPSDPFAGLLAESELWLEPEVSKGAGLDEDGGEGGEILGGRGTIATMPMESNV